MSANSMLDDILTTRMEQWGFIKSSAQTYTGHMKLSFQFCISAQTKTRVLHGGHHRGILKPDYGGIKPHNHTFESRGGPHSII
jgi:hypothetical protein